jgi:hypothetical protein
VAKIVSLSPRVKAKDIVLHRVRYWKNRWIWVPIEDKENVTSLDIFGSPGKTQNYIEIFHVQFKNSNTTEEISVLQLPDPERPVFARLSDKELDQRKEKLEEKCLVIEECDLDNQILPILDYKSRQVWKFSR